MPRTHAPVAARATARRSHTAAVTLAACLLIAPAANAAGPAHSHGLARLDIAVESKRLSLQFSSPLDNLVGFERAPRTDKERQQTDAAVAKLNAAETLFRIDPAARCKLAKTELTSAVLKLGPPVADAGKSEHADIDGRFDFDCADAAKAAYIDIGLFEFKRLQRLEVQVAAPGGQFKRVVKATVPRLALTR
jgi:hypothetical protein